jgi:penicillin-binding protein 1C
VACTSIKLRPPVQGHGSQPPRTGRVAECADRTLVVVSPARFTTASGSGPAGESGELRLQPWPGQCGGQLTHACGNAYRTLANGGRFNPTSLTRENRFSNQCWTPGCIHHHRFILAQTRWRVPLQHRHFGFCFWTAVKRHQRDMQDAGQALQTLVGVWVGNGASCGRPDGTSGAAPIWATLMRHLRQQPVVLLSASRCILALTASAQLEAARNR